MNDVFRRLKPAKYRTFILNTVPIIDESAAKNLVGRNIHFTWWNKKDKTMETLPGKVISYGNGKLKVFAYNIIFEEKSEDVPDNKMIRTIPIEEIEDYMIFEQYTREFWNLAEIIECDENNKPLTKIYRVENLFNECVECVIELFDSFSIVFAYKLSNDGIVRVGYPMYFLKSIELLNK